MSEPTRPLPDLDEPDTGQFWRHAAEQRLTFQRCAGCERPVFFPRNHCPSCGGTDLSWEDSSGSGTIYSRTVIRRHGHPFFRDRCPYVVAWIDLDEGFRMLAEVVADDPESVAIGDRVQVEWEEHAEGSIPLFRALR